MPGRRPGPVGQYPEEPIDEGTLCRQRSSSPGPLGTHCEPSGHFNFTTISKWHKSAELPKFEVLWREHPNVKGNAPLLDKSVYENQCAINLYAALQASGIDTNKFRGQLSWQADKPKYAIRAQELADWLSLKSSGMQSPEKYSGNEAFDKIKGRTGIIFFQNYWGAGNQGDHIDLWNGSRLTSLDSWLRIHVRIGQFGMHSLGFGSDFEKSQAIWFWALP